MRERKDDGIEPEFGQEARAIVRRGDAWETQGSDGRRWRSSHVIVATGANHDPNAPGFPGQAGYRGRIMHSREYRDAAPFAGQRVLVVGMGNTGAEIALDLAEQGAQPTVAVRPAPVAEQGELAGLYFVGFDVRQPGGLLRTIGSQALTVAEAIAGPRSDEAIVAS